MFPFNPEPQTLPYKCYLVKTEFQKLKTGQDVA